MPRIAIKVENVSKKYQIKRRLGDGSGSFKEVLNKPFIGLFNRSNHTNRQNESSEIFWALKNVCFEMEHGESIGLIGRNGAGKTTLLKILSRITRPSTGRVTLYEHVNSLLEIGTGFNLDLSGRDNVYLNGSFLGMKRVEIDRKFDEILDFSGIEHFIDTPVKYYSSGMFVRLAFSVAVNLTPETLLLDEVLAVGDADFKQKSLKKMKELLGSGATIILVSHNENSIKEICKRAIWLLDGEIKMDGPSYTVVESYIQSIGQVVG
jgi:lipopolysaccharide transport system ATP-binding protein